MGRAIAILVTLVVATWGCSGGSTGVDAAGEADATSEAIDVILELPDATLEVVEVLPGCCDGDPDCPAHQVCTKYGTCQDQPAWGRCWKDGDCYETQTCAGATDCPCGTECGQITVAGTCQPLPSGCCYVDDDCNEDVECRGGEPNGNVPGRCVASHLGPACPGDAACCWNDAECPGGWCEGAYACGCVELCPTCGACAEPRMGMCHSFTVQVDAQLASGKCQSEPETHPAFSWYLVKLTWTTSAPARSTIGLALNGFTGLEGSILVEEGYVTEHATEFSVSHMHFGTVPKAGDQILFRVAVETESGGKGLSNTITVPVDQALRDCLYPYDPACSDGEAIWCRALPPPCAQGLVMAAIDHCQRCVNPFTCLPPD